MRCERKGHKWRAQTRRGYEHNHPDFDFWHFRCTAHAVTQEREVCRRCKLTTDWETVSDRCIQTLTISTHLFDRLTRSKVVWVGPDAAEDSDYYAES